jgi:25S rRNA (cytosine2278-C5)-methyltransferase
MFLPDESQISRGAFLVLLYDLVLGQGVKPRGTAERVLLRESDAIASAAAALAAASGVASVAALVAGAPRADKRATRDTTLTVRVNTLLATVVDVAAALRAPPATWPEKHRTPAAEVAADPILDSVLHVHGAPREMHDHPLVVTGALVMQSRASCTPAAALDPQRGWHVLDACAAPGNKATHAAALVGPSGRVTAVERDAVRAETLQRSVARTGAAHVTVLVEVRIRAA